MTATGPVLLISEVARRLGVSAAYVRKLADDGRLPSQRATRGVRLFLAEDVDALAASRSLQEQETIKSGEQ
jgi:excisionase family DNA binding protein